MIAVAVAAVAAVGGLVATIYLLLAQQRRLINAVIAKHASDVARLDPPSHPPVRRTAADDEQLSVVEGI